MPGRPAKIILKIYNFLSKRLILSCFVLIFLGCTARIPVTLDGKNIICFGDSITEGVGAGQGEDYPSVLSAKLNRPVINAGVSGDTTRRALARLEKDVLENNPGLVIVEFGANDFFQKIPSEEIFQNLDKMVETLQGHNVMVVLAAIRVGLFVDEYYDGFKKVALKRKALLIPDIMKGIFGNPDLKSDELHPNAKGYAIIAEKVYKSIAPLIK